MRTKEEMPACPVATTVSLIGSKWKLLIMRNLLVRPWRFNELRKDLDGISQKVLTDSLRSMETDGLVGCTLFSQRCRLVWSTPSARWGNPCSPSSSPWKHGDWRTKAELYPERKNKNKMPRLLSVQDRKQSGHSRIIRWGQSSRLPCSQPRAR